MESHRDNLGDHYHLIASLSIQHRRAAIYAPGFIAPGPIPRHDQHRKLAPFHRPNREDNGTNRSSRDEINPSHLVLHFQHQPQRYFDRLAVHDFRIYGFYQEVYK